jgi:dTMP kinase
MEEADRAFFARVAEGYRAIAAAEPERIYQIDATRSAAQVQKMIWEKVSAMLETKARE